MVSCHPSICFVPALGMKQSARPDLPGTEGPETFWYLNRVVGSRHFGQLRHFGRQYLDGGIPGTIL
jgi:hypothetical protein